MKNLFLTLFLLSLNLLANELQWVDEQIEAIQPPRVGISESEIALLKDPFIFLKKSDTNTTVNTTTTTLVTTDIQMKKEPIEKKELILDAIMNKSALIDGKWYKLNDKIDDLTISDISTTTVTLSKKGKKEILSTNKNKNLKFKNK